MGPMLFDKRTSMGFLFGALGDGNHYLQVCTSGPPSLVAIEDYGWDASATAKNRPATAASC